MEPTAQDRSCYRDAEEFAKPVLKSFGSMASGILRTLFLGMLASGSTRLTRIGRAIWPRKPIRTSENLLSRYLVNSRVDMTRVRHAHLSQQARKVDRDAYVYIDPSDAAKPYARVMEHLAWVRDGDQKQIVHGYWTLHVVACNGPGEVVGLGTEIFSVEDPRTPSFPGFVHSRIGEVDEALGPKGIFVLDQGLTSDEQIRQLVGRRRRFIGRIVESRAVQAGNGQELGILADFGRSVPYDYRVVTWDSQKKRQRYWDLFWTTVRLPGIEEVEFGLVCVRWRHRGEMKYFFLLTNQPLMKGWNAERVLSGYLRRQVVEDYIRLLKEEVEMEDFLVQRFERIYRIVWVAGWVANFLVEQNAMGVRRMRTFIRRVKALVKNWKEKWTLAAWGFADALSRILRRRAPPAILRPT